MPKIETLSADAATDAILDAVNRDGAVVLKDLMSQSLADQFYAETIDFINASPKGNGFTGEHTTRTGALVARSAACRELVTNRKVLDAVYAYLASYCERVQLHLTQVIRIMPGQKAQPLHRDRQAWGSFLPASIEPQLNTIWAQTDFTRENGATRIAPGSHLWPYDRKAEEHELAYAEMSRGSVLVYSGSVIHGGGANTADSERMGTNITYSLGWLRQEENQFLSCPPNIARQMDPELQELLGYTMGSTACGYFTEPLPAGEARELCPPEFALGRKPRPSNTVGIVDQES